MHIKLTNGQPLPYSLRQLRQDNPQVSFPETIADTLLAEYGVYPVASTPAPAHAATEVAEDVGCLQLADESWVQAWRVRPMNEDEIAALAQQKDDQRKFAYQNEADPLFFKWQRGEATQQQWLDKVAEIKKQYV